MKKWYIIKTQPGFEKYVKTLILKQIIHDKVTHKFGSIIIPTEQVMGQLDNKKIDRKFFPGYILIEVTLDVFIWHLIKKICKVQGFVSTNPGKPIPLEDTEINSLFLKIEESDNKPKPVILYSVGEIIRIKSGPFSDFTGKIESVNYNKNKLNVSVIIFGRHTPIELKFTQVEKE